MAAPAWLQQPQLRNAAAGGLGGLAGWAFLIEPVLGRNIERVESLGAMLGMDALMGAAAGLCIGFLIGAADDLLERSWQAAARSGGEMAVFGLAGGIVGLVLGEIIFQVVGFIPFVGRAIGWGLFGALLGAATGLRRRSAAGVRNGALGGLIGGALGGILFDLIGLLLGMLAGSALSRAAALTAVGAAIGYFIAVVERALATGTLKVISGRHEGRTFVLDKPRLSVGSADRSDILLLGDAAIKPLHATLRLSQGHCAVQAEPGAPVSVNGQAVGSAGLTHGDQLLIGATRLVYRRTADESARLRGYQRAPLSSMTPAPGPAVRTPPLILPAPAAAPPPGAALAPGAAVVLVEVATGRRFPVTHALRLGRAPGNEVLLNDPSVSAQHAELQIDQGRLLVRDLGSRNGVFVNGRRINGVNLLKPGWTLQVGDVALRVEGS